MWWASGSLLLQAWIPAGVNVSQSMNGEQAEQQLKRSGIISEYQTYSRTRHAIREHTSNYANQVTAVDIRFVAEQPGQDLTTIVGPRAREYARENLLIRDGHADVSFSHLFHAALEETGTVPTWTGWRNWLRNSGATKVHQDSSDLRQQARSSLSHWIAEAAAVYGMESSRAAARWRIGLAYLSFLRELWVLGKLRESGLRVYCHPYVDLTYRIDGWLIAPQPTVLELYVANSRFRNADTGRKNGARKYIHQAKLVEIGLNPHSPRRVGDLFVPTEPELQSAIDLILGGGR